MSDKTGVRRGGLGRGLGALIPTGPLPGASGKGHFWNALDRPPVPDPDADVDSPAAPVLAEGGSEHDSTTMGRHHLEATHAGPGQSEDLRSEADDPRREGDYPRPEANDHSPIDGASADDPTALGQAGDVHNEVTDVLENDRTPEHESERRIDADTSADLDRRGVNDTPAARDSAVPSDHPQVVDAYGLETAGQDHEVADSTAVMPTVDNYTSAQPVTDERYERALESVTADVAVMVDVPVGSIHPNPKQPRQVFDDENIAELAHSIREVGLLQPIVVRRTGASDSYELVMGERRLRAAKVAGLESVAVILRNTADEAMLRDALLENIHRVQLNPLEEAAAYEQLLVEFDVTHEELASRIGRSRSQVSNTIRLLKLPVKVQQRLAAGVLSAGHARALLSMDSADDQDALATRIVAEGMSVRATEEAVATQSSDGPARRPVQRRRNVSAPALAELAERLSDSFDTRVLVQLGRRKGKVVIEFASIDDLERIIATMSPQLATAARGVAPEPDGQVNAQLDDGGLIFSEEEPAPVEERFSDVPG